jgi:hypothetical protein
LRLAAVGCVTILVAGVLVVSVADHTAAKGQLETQLEQAAKDPANRATARPTGATRPSTATAAPPGTAGTTIAGPVPTTVAPPPATAAPGPGSPAPGTGPLAIGDSVMLGAANALRAAIPGVRVDAEVGRQWSDGIALARSLGASGQLGTTVIIGLGNNGVVTPAGFDAMMAALSGVPRVIVVDLRVDRSWQNADNAVLRAGAARHPGVRLLDWYGDSFGHASWFFADGTHLRPQAATNYTALIAGAVAAPGP